MNQLKKLIDRAIFLVLCVVMIALFVFWKGCDMKGPGKGQPDGKTDTHQLQEGATDLGSPEQKSNISDVTPPSESSNVVKLFLGRKGVSENQATWYDIGEFAGFIKQLQDRGVKEVHYSLLPDSIERYEERWAEELKKANLRSYINSD